MGLIVGLCIFFLLNSIFLFIASIVYDEYGEDWGDVILITPLIIGILWILSLF